MSDRHDAIGVVGRRRNESDDSCVPGLRRGHCGHCGDGAAQPARSDRTEIKGTQEHVENRGIAWVVGAFVICPCHLPLTMALATTLLAGTAAGAALRGHPLVAGTIITLAWLAATWHGVRLLRQPPG